MTSESALPPPSDAKSENGCLYILGGLSFIPVIGVPFGCFAFFAGLFTWKRGGWKLSLIGAGGVLFTVAIYSALFYFGFVQRGGVYDGLRAQMAQQQLSSLVKTIEYHRLQHGHYPAALSDLDTSGDTFVSIFDTTDVSLEAAAKPREYYYELNLTSQTYVLFSVGRDGQPYTKDDILPSIQEAETAHIGYRIRALQPQPSER